MATGLEVNSRGWDGTITAPLAKNLKTEGPTQKYLEDATLSDHFKNFRQIVWNLFSTPWYLEEDVPNEAENGLQNLRTAISEYVSRLAEVEADVALSDIKTVITLFADFRFAINNAAEKESVESLKKRWENALTAIDEQLAVLQPTRDNLKRLITASQKEETEE